jgi:hypothetical protein
MVRLLSVYISRFRPHSWLPPLGELRAGLRGGYAVNRWLHDHFDLDICHHFVDGMHADNNITDNVIQQLKTKLHFIRAFRAPHWLLPLQEVHEPSQLQHGKSPIAIACLTISSSRN